MPVKQYLLILACSKRKLDNKELLPAIERYDGGSYRVIRKARREKSNLDNIKILILSAKYGLIEAFTPIANYEQRINQHRAKELNHQVLSKLEKYAKKDSYIEIYLDLGLDYNLAIEGIRNLFPRSQIIFAKGRIGERLRQLKLWLEEKSIEIER